MDNSPASVFTGAEPAEYDVEYVTRRKNHRSNVAGADAVMFAAGNDVDRVSTRALAVHYQIGSME